MMKKLVCMNCGHRGQTWKPHDNVGEMFMDCRIRAPIASQEDAEAWWPVVRESDWCHEWTQPTPDGKAEGECGECNGTGLVNGEVVHDLDCPACSGGDE